MSQIALICFSLQNVSEMRLVGNALSRWMWSRSGATWSGGLWWRRGGLKKEKNEDVLEVTGIHREFIQHDIDPCDEVGYIAFQILCIFLVIITTI